VIIHTPGNADAPDKTSRVAPTPGVTWSQRSSGTNAIGTALAEGRPTTIHAGRYYLTANHFLTCSAAPVVGHRGNVVGVLDIELVCATKH
jgi:transcriptional regulator of acetoin/glycerol metabolism